jgi:hypothetical protein
LVKVILEETDLEVKQNILKGDNMSSMQVEMSGKTSSGKVTHQTSIIFTLLIFD